MESNDSLTKKELPEVEESTKKILKVAKQLKLARQMGVFKCPNGEKGCRACRPMETIIKGEAELVGQDGYRADVYILDKPSKMEEEDARVL